MSGFLVADTQLYERLCPSVGPLIRWSVGGHLVEKWENEHFRYFVCEVCLCVKDGGWSVDGGWIPLPTRPQRYCDPHVTCFMANVYGQTLALLS